MHQELDAIEVQGPELVPLGDDHQDVGGFGRVIGRLLERYAGQQVLCLGAAFGVPPVQFGVIFIMNLLLGFLTPTVGMNIFLASYTFKKPVPRIVRDVWPFIIVQAAVLLLVTYVPGLSTIFK